MCGARIYGERGYAYHGPHSAGVWLHHPVLGRPANDNLRTSSFSDHLGQRGLEEVMPTTPSTRAEGRRHWAVTRRDPSR